MNKKGYNTENRKIRQEEKRPWSRKLSEVRGDGGNTLKKSSLLDSIDGLMWEMRYKSEKKSKFCVYIAENRGVTDKAAIMTEQRDLVVGTFHDDRILLCTLQHWQLDKTICGVDSRDKREEKEMSCLDNCFPGWGEAPQCSTYIEYISNSHW